MNGVEMRSIHSSVIHNTQVDSDRRELKCVYTDFHSIGFIDW